MGCNSNEVSDSKVHGEMIWNVFLCMGLILRTLPYLIFDLGIVVLLFLCMFFHLACLGYLCVLCGLFHPYLIYKKKSFVDCAA